MKGKTNLQKLSTNVPTPTMGGSNWTLRSFVDGSSDRMRPIDGKSYKNLKYIMPKH